MLKLLAEFWKGEASQMTKVGILSMASILAVLVVLSLIAFPMTASSDQACCPLPIGNCHFIQSCPYSPCSIWAQDGISGCREWYTCCQAACPCSYLCTHRCYNRSYAASLSFSN